MTPAAKSSDLTARMRGLASRERAPAQTEPSREARPVRITVDLARPAHRQLKRYTADHEVRAADVVRVLLGLLDTDPDVAAKVAEQLRERSQ